MKIQIVIPARLASTRLPEKLLRIAGGKSILHHTFLSAANSVTVKSSTCEHALTVAVDDVRLADEVQAFGGHFQMTSSDCNSGTDRVAEVARQEPATDVFVNVQGDEPEIDPAAIDLVAQALIDTPSADMATIVTPIRDPGLLADPACVKAVVNDTGKAIYFSRAPVPFAREGFSESILDQYPIFYQHIGLYAYRREFLEWFTAQPPSPLEQVERLEQLRAIEAGKLIAVRTVDHATPGIDTLEDLNDFKARLA